MVLLINRTQAIRSANVRRSERASVPNMSSFDARITRIARLLNSRQAINRMLLVEEAIDVSNR